MPRLLRYTRETRGLVVVVVVVSNRSAGDSTEGFRVAMGSRPSSGTTRKCSEQFTPAVGPSEMLFSGHRLWDIGAFDGGARWANFVGDCRKWIFSQRFETHREFYGYIVSGRCYNYHLACACVALC